MVCIIREKIMAKMTYEEKIYSADLTEKDKKILRIYRTKVV